MYAALEPASSATHSCRYRPTARELAHDQRMGLRDVTVAILVAAACALVVLFVGARSATGLVPVEEGVAFQRAVVQDGDSLWALAEEHPVHGMSTRQVVDLVTERNGLSTSVLRPGQSILVPAASSSILA